MSCRTVFLLTRVSHELPDCIYTCPMSHVLPDCVYTCPSVSWVARLCLYLPDVSCVAWLCLYLPECLMSCLTVFILAQCLMCCPPVFILARVSHELPDCIYTCPMSHVLPDCVYTCPSVSCVARLYLYLPNVSCVARLCLYLPECLMSCPTVSVVRAQLSLTSSDGQQFNASTMSQVSCDFSGMLTLISGWVVQRCIVSWQFVMLIKTSACLGECVLKKLEWYYYFTCMRFHLFKSGSYYFTVPSHSVHMQV